MPTALNGRHGPLTPSWGKPPLSLPQGEVATVCKELHRLRADDAEISCERHDINSRQRFGFPHTRARALPAAYPVRARRPRAAYGRAGVGAGGRPPGVLPYSAGLTRAAREFAIQ